ncbi:hypothetical protein AB0M87_12415 [Streptomyces sp. NPDC051320]|uniref:hypothetical protein n=1 Tax=Streptomyces sp. NPDC051320 TaxID=3154644 RepID=UPI003430AFAA
MAALGKQLRKTASELERQIRNLKAVADVEAWDSEAGKEFRQKAKGNVKKLEAALKRYDTAADAIGTSVTEDGGTVQDKIHAKPKDYASDLNRAQEIADAALKDAKDADERKGAAQRSLDTLSDKKSSSHTESSSGGHGSDRKKIEAKRDAAHGEIEAAKERISQAKSIRDAAADRARESIDAVISHDSLKDGFWETQIQNIADFTSMVSTWCGILSLVVGWIPVIGQALAGVLGAIAMIATLVNTLTTLVQVFQGNADWLDLGMSALGFLMMGAGKAFSKVAGKFAKTALGRMGRAAKATTTKQISRNNKALRKISAKKFKLGKGEGWKSLKEPFLEPFSKRAWVSNVNTLKFGRGNYRAAWNQIGARGGGNPVKGLGRSVSMVDPGVASDLKDIKLGVSGLGNFDPNAINRISKTASRMSVVGAGMTLGGLGLDGNLNPLLG